MSAVRHLLGGPLLCFLACTGEGTPRPGAPSLSGTPVTLTRFRAESFAYAFNSGITAAMTLVVRDPVAWSQLWESIHAFEDSAPPLPEVDFSREMVVAVGLGNRSSGGYDVLLARAVGDESGLRIEVVETRPGQGCATTLAMTQPVDLARTPRREGPVQFITTQRVRACS